MAVTEILGTDSLSSSRVTINDNFNSLQAEIVDLKALLDPTTNALTGVSANLLSLVVSGATALAAASATSFSNTGETSLGGSVIKSGSYQDIATSSATLPIPYILLFTCLFGNMIISINISFAVCGRD